MHRCFLTALAMTVIVPVPGAAQHLTLPAAASLRASVVPAAPSERAAAASEPGGIVQPARERDEAGASAATERRFGVASCAAAACERLTTPRAFPTMAPGLAPQVIPPAGQPHTALDIVAGYAGFLDDSLIGHAVVGGGVRFRLGRILSVGPEAVYVSGPGGDRDLFLTGNATFDFRVPESGPLAGTISPYLVAGGGLMVHRSRFPEVSGSEGALTGGVGVRVWITDRVYALGEYRAGWEPHIRANGGIGVAW